jgi:hypothetical protein
VQAALPKIRKLAERLARRLRGTGLDVDELETMAQDFFMGRARHWDPGRKTPLYDFAHRDVTLDVLRAACAHDRGTAACMRAMDHQEDAIVETDTAMRWAESPEEKEARAIALGQDQAIAGLYSYSAAQPAPSPEDEYGSREVVEVMKRTASEGEPCVAELLDLLFVHDLTWEEASARVGMDKRQAQRIMARAFARLRAIFGPKTRRGPA